jgi:chromosome segregation ATPase
MNRNRRRGTDHKGTTLVRFLEEKVMLGPLRDLTRVPNAILGAAGTTMEAARNLRTLQRIVTDRLASLDGGLREITAVLPTLADDLKRVRATIEPQHERVADIQAGLTGLLPLAHDVKAMRATIEPQHERVAIIERALDILPQLGANLTAVVATIEPQHERVAAIERDVGLLNERLAGLQQTLSHLKKDVADATELLPDPDAPGPIARAREALTR